MEGLSGIEDRKKSKLRISPRSITLLPSNRCFVRQARMGTVDGAGWDTEDGQSLVQVLQKLARGNRSQPNTAVGSLAAEILKGVKCQDGTGTKSTSDLSQCT
ncbi:serine/threonine-protein kinase ULK4 isoform X1 [Tachysurus ichikawai]